MFHVRSYSVRLKKRNIETVSSFRRNLQRRKLGSKISNASTTSEISNDSLSNRRRSASIVDTSGVQHQPSQQSMAQTSSSIVFDENFNTPKKFNEEILPSTPSLPSPFKPAISPPLSPPGTTLRRKSEING